MSKVERTTWNLGRCSCGNPFQRVIARKKKWFIAFRLDGPRTGIHGHSPRLFALPAGFDAKRVAGDPRKPLEIYQTRIHRGDNAPNQSPV